MITHRRSRNLSQPLGHEMPIAGVLSAPHHVIVFSDRHRGGYPWMQLEAGAGAHLQPPHTWHIQAQGTWPAERSRARIQMIGCGFY